MKPPLAEVCLSHGIQPTYVGIDGVERPVATETLERLAVAFGIDGPSASPPPAGIAEALREHDAPRCHVPEALDTARVWGLTCQLPALASARNLGIGDFADLARLCELAAEAGADFLGINPLHALFWSDPARVSPFFPSNRRFLNPLYLAPDWIDGFDGLTEEEAAEADRLRRTRLLDAPGVARLKDRVLRRLFARAGGSDEARRFRAEGGPALEGHAVFEAISAAMAAEGGGAGWSGWPEALRDRTSPAVADMAERHRAEVDYHLWLQWQAARQVARVQAEALAAGMRIGLYLDFAVGAAPDGSAAWSDPALTVPGASVGAPPDYFNANGQDWGLAPLSPVALAETDGRAVAEILAAVMRPAGAVRIDHAMSLARLWLIPRGLAAAEGAYVRYPLSSLLRRLAEASREAGTLVIGEDLGVVPAGFRDLMAKRRLHAYKVFFFESGPTGYGDPADWPGGALACLATHDMPSFTGWWRGSDLRVRRQLGMLDTNSEAAEAATRARERAAIRALTAPAGEEQAISTHLHAHIADSPCRLAALQLEDALGIEEQVNIPGTIDEHPNWRRRLPVPLERIAAHPGFRAHAAAMRSTRPR